MYTLGRFLGMGRTLRPVVMARPTFSTSTPVRSSMFGEVTEGRTVAEPEPVEENVEKTVGEDSDLQNHKMEEALRKQVEASKFITPLKKSLFEEVVAKNGFFKNNQIVNFNSKVYKLTLTPEEIDILEPSVYLSSYRLKSTLKKATQVNRFVRGMGVKNAINQLHFNPKKMSTELEKLLKRALAQATESGLDGDKMYIEALWVGSDGDWIKRIDHKGRGRHGIINHSFVHLKVILKSEQTKLRRAYERQQKIEAGKPRMFLNNEPLNFKVRGFYKW